MSLHDLTLNNTVYFVVQQANFIVNSMNLPSIPFRFIHYLFLLLVGFTWGYLSTVTISQSRAAFSFVSGSSMWVSGNTPSSDPLESFININDINRIIR